MLTNIRLKILVVSKDVLRPVALEFSNSKICAILKDHWSVILISNSFKCWIVLKRCQVDVFISLYVLWRRGK